MSGQVIFNPGRLHECVPGWRDVQGSDGRAHGVLPSAREFPKGTVWQCACGRTWVSFSPAVGSDFPRWKREGRWARKRRQRRERDQER